jgi:hypothetical protein
MACFLVPTAEAIVASVVEHKTGRKPAARPGQIGWRARLNWLTTLLWGGAILLALEHLWHGEVSFAFPFLTAVREGETAAMLHEMGTVGVAMALAVTAVWGAMVVVAEKVPAVRRALAGQA